MERHAKNFRLQKSVSCNDDSGYEGANNVFSRKKAESSKIFDPGLAGQVTQGMHVAPSVRLIGGGFFIACFTFQCCAPRARRFIKYPGGRRGPPRCLQTQDSPEIDD